MAVYGENSKSCGCGHPPPRHATRQRASGYLLHRPRPRGVPQYVLRLRRALQPASVGLLPHEQSRSLRSGPGGRTKSGASLRTHPQRLRTICESGTAELWVRVFGRTHSDYARYANLVQRSCGHFWQARFYSCALDEDHVWRALAYVERNPVRAAMVAWQRNTDGRRQRRTAWTTDWM